MKKYILYTSVLGGIVLLSLFAIEFALRQIPNRYSVKAHYMQENHDRIDELVLGSSHAFMGINPEKLSPDAYNLANVSQSLDYDYYLLRKYINKSPNLHTVYLSVSVFSFYSLLKDTEKHFIPVYKQAFDLVQIPFDIKSSCELLYGSEPVEKLINHYIRKKDMVMTTCKGLSLMYSLENKTHGAAGKNAKQRAKAHTYHQLNPVAVACFRNIINLCKEHDIRLVVVTLPVTEEYAKYIDPKQHQQTVSIVENEIAAYRNAIYLNYFDDYSWSATEAYFYDADHLTPQGADAFTVSLRDSVNRIDTSHVESKIPLSL